MPRPDATMPLKERLIRYYQHYNPAQIAKVDGILDLYEHDSVALFADLAMRYGPEPPVDAPVSQGPGATADRTAQVDPRSVSSGLPPAPPPPDQPPSQPSERQQSAMPWTTVSAEVPPDSTASPVPPPPLTTHNLAMLPQDVLASSTLSATAMPEAMADASSPYYRNSAHRRFSATVATGGGDPHVLDGAFSPTRRRLPNRLGGLFADAGGTDASGHGAPMGEPSMVHPDASGVSVLRSRDPTSTSSDALVASATSVIYRRDTKATTEAAARMIMEEAKRHASIGHLAATTVRSMQRAVAADCYQSRLDALRHPLDQQRSTSHQTQVHPSVPPPVRVMQSMLNVDEMSSYQALASRQRSASNGTPSAEASDGEGRYAGAVSGPRVGGLFIPASHPRPLVGRSLTPYDSGVGGASAGVAASVGGTATTDAELLRRRLRTLQTSPLVSKVRATNGGLPQRTSAASSTSTVAEPVRAVANGANDDDGAVDMICTECGLICSIVPGREHEAGHFH